MKNISVIILLLVLCTVVSAKIIRVPADQSTIQAGINSSSNGDTVVVSPGTYYENIFFRGKKIVLTSRYYETRDVNFISSTIINGNKPTYPDTASCVLIINGEDSTTVLQGFTLTAGKGTAWKDEHGAGVYREGGGVLTAFSSPIIRNNYIFNNEAINATGLVSGGGGGIRSGDGSPRIEKNVIAFNKGMYGGGIVLNYCDGAVIKNNIIYQNKVNNYGKSTFGGGGIWINDILSSKALAHSIENNTINYNIASDVGGEPAGAGAAILVWNNAKAMIRNNIMRKNFSVSPLGALANVGSTATITYNNMTDTISGTGNNTVEPAFADSNFYLTQNSPCVDAGDPLAMLNDVENSSSPGSAMFPSRGGLRNDMGAYGGIGAVLHPNFNRQSIFIPLPKYDFGYVLPGSYSTKVTYWNFGTLTLGIDSIVTRGKFISIKTSGLKNISPLKNDTILVAWNPQPKPAIFLSDTVLVYHNDTLQANPLRIVITGKSFVIETAQRGMMYAFSGAADSGKLYTVDTATAKSIVQGGTNYPSVVSARINPLTKEIIAVTLDGTDQQLIRVSSVGAYNLPLSKIGAANVKGMAFQADGTLYLGSFGGNIYTVNINSGVTTQIAATGLRIAGMAFNPTNGALWFSVRPTSGVKDNIYKMNLVTGVSTVVGATGFGVATKDITFDDKGRMFGVIDTAGAQSYLIQIDTTTGKGKVIGGMGVKGIETIELSSYFVTSVSSQSKNLPQDFMLEQNYPNPFNPTTSITFSIPAYGRVQLKVFDTLGRVVATLFDGIGEAKKYHSAIFDATNLSSGIYFASLEWNGKQLVKKMMLVK